MVAFFWLPFQPTQKGYTPPKNARRQSAFSRTEVFATSGTNKPQAKKVEKEESLLKAYHHIHHDKELRHFWPELFSALKVASFASFGLSGEPQFKVKACL